MPASSCLQEGQGDLCWDWALLETMVSRQSVPGFTLSQPASGLTDGRAPFLPSSPSCDH